jgi:phosphoenolpyruvate synthase/pyruvate phosphate dikinase
VGTSGIHKAREGHPATIRLLDPPLRGFLPHDVAGQEEDAEVMRVPVNVIREKVNALHELNPMLGHRGCRLGITYPDEGCRLCTTTLHNGLKRQPGDAPGAGRRTSV